ncbi:MAG: hypothetical protein A3D65_01420 [Candidatus Lloydbacteria bacterium RIFCSPHIGHO2_02_FULL_50_13]|uniref:Peptidase S11 D-alanyl-D-alanine carboxypeptidase A N-terminal domain-containing protein n=1 Tax=Candidatus Lloydbacteria bacterium RIFCSPHIGHO2_02_FULL_50_13 TaxID=1798661 RepID=A0A1G2D253_9BACT|nr:MAG: hypothetical protein A3D65_01420 [Candidatus Lloydbacteria bacterium RIFCSPHIGHO2_02_FULL_50_13]
MPDRTTQVQLFLAVLLLGLLAGPGVIEALQRLPLKGAEGVASSAKALKRQGGEAQAPSPAPYDPFRSLILQAKSAYVWDVNAHRKLYAKNAEARLPLASVTKIMTALVAAEAMPKDTLVTIGREDIAQEGDTGLYAGEVWTLEKLLAFTLVASSNDGASAIAAAGSISLQGGPGTTTLPHKDIFVLHMNEKARAIGLTQTTFQNESGLDVAAGVSGGYGSARDMAMLFEYVFRKHPDIFLPTAQSRLTLRSESGFVHEVANTNQDVVAISGIIGSKTGYTELAGGNLVVVVDIGISHPVVIVVLGSTQEKRFEDVKKLIAATTETITNQPER